jgi:hypothetical protein
MDENGSPRGVTNRHRIETSGVKHPCEAMGCLSSDR